MLGSTSSSSGTDGSLPLHRLRPSACFCRRQHPGSCRALASLWSLSFPLQPLIFRPGPLFHRLALRSHGLPASPCILTVLLPPPPVHPQLPAVPSRLPASRPFPPAARPRLLPLRPRIPSARPRVPPGPPRGTSSRLPLPSEAFRVQVTPPDFVSRMLGLLARTSHRSPEERPALARCCHRSTTFSYRSIASSHSPPGASHRSITCARLPMASVQLPVVLTNRSPGGHYGPSSQFSWLATTLLGLPGTGPSPSGALLGPSVLLQPRTLPPLLARTRAMRPLLHFFTRLGSPDSPPMKKRPGSRAPGPLLELSPPAD